MFSGVQCSIGKFDQVALELGDNQWAHHFCRFEPLGDNLPSPLALRYHGHQFRVYNPDLGDGRGFLFAQLREGRADDATLKLRVEEAFVHLDEQLEKSVELAARTGEFVAGRGRE